MELTRGSSFVADRSLRTALGPDTRSALESSTGDSFPDFRVGHIHQIGRGKLASSRTSHESSLMMIFSLSRLSRTNRKTFTHKQVPSLLTAVTHLSYVTQTFSCAQHGRANSGALPLHQPAHVYLQEDGLELWQILLKRSSTLSPEMAGLLPLLVALLSAGTDVLPRCLKILESYLLLDAAQVLAVCCLPSLPHPRLANDVLSTLQGYSSALFGAIETLMGDLKPEAVKQILHATNTIFQVAPVETWAAALDQSMLLIKLLSPLAVEQTATLTVTKREYDAEKLKPQNADAPLS